MESKLKRMARGMRTAAASREKGWTDRELVRGLRPVLSHDGEAPAAGPWEVVVCAGGEAPARSDAGTALVAVGMDVEAILRLFWSWMRLEVGDGQASPLTLAGYAGDVRQHLVWLAGQGLTPATATPDTLKGFRAHLVELYKVTTAGRKLAAVRRFYQMAQGHGFLPANPAFGLRSPREKTEQYERIKYLSLDSIRAVLVATETASTPAMGLRDKAIIVLMAKHGLRVCEIGRLDVGDVDLDAGQLEVLGKGNKRRSVILTRRTKPVLEMWLAARRLMMPQNDALFLNMHWSGGAGQRMSTRGIREMVDGYLLKVGAKRDGVSCHALRHTYATQSLMAGASLLAISGSMGHSSVTTTQVYAKIVDKVRNNPTEFLDEVL